MERKIGEIFEYKGEWYQCVEGGTCSECSFRHIDCNISNIGDCTDKRTDGETVIFKKLEKVGEPHWIGKRLMQPYELFTKAVTPLGLDCFSIWHQDLTIEIEIKQNQKDMEEKKLSLKPFDLEAARKGKPVCTRDGRKARIICFDAKGDKPIIALVEMGTAETPNNYPIDGKAVSAKETSCDLMMLPEKHEGWVNICKETSDKPYALCNIFEHQKDAVESGQKRKGYLATVKISWEDKE